MRAILNDDVGGGGSKLNNLYIDSSSVFSACMDNNSNRCMPEMFFIIIIQYHIMNYGGDIDVLPSMRSCQWLYCALYFIN